MKKTCGKKYGRKKNQEERGSISGHIVILLNVPAKRVATFYITWLHSHYAVMVRCFVDIYIHMLSEKETHDTLFKEYLAFVYINSK